MTTANRDAATLTSAPLPSAHSALLLWSLPTEEKRKTAQSSRHSTISLQLSAIQAFFPIFGPFKHFSQSSSTTGWGLVVRSGAASSVTKEPYCCSHFVQPCLLRVSLGTFLKVICTHQEGLKPRQMKRCQLKGYFAADSLTFNRCGNQRYPNLKSGFG